MDADLVIAGGGPAGMMAGLLFARAGVKTIVLEKHGDFLRDFRGDTVHPSTLDLLDELGLLDDFLALPHDKVPGVGAVIGGREYRVGDFTHLPGRGTFIAMMPQWEFLNFLAEKAKAYPCFELRMQTEAVALVEGRGDTNQVVEGPGRIEGVELKDGTILKARLIICADGRGSILRDQARLPLEDLGAPIDVFWFRVPKERTADNLTQGHIAGGQMIVAIDRGDYFQCAKVIPKGGAAAIEAEGIAKFRADVVATVPMLASHVDAVASFDDVKLLSVSLNRLTRWHRPGLLAIGDAAHAMSAVGGVGVNLAVQDAVAAANILAGPMRAGEDPDPLLARVQKRRMFAIRIVQGMQRRIHNTVLTAALANKDVKAPWPLKLLDRVPLLQRIPARIVGLGVRRERIRSPTA